MSNRLIRGLAVLLFWGTVFAQGSTPQGHDEARGTAKVSGRVTRTDTGAAVDGATIRLLSLGSPGRTATADEFGRFEFANVPPGEYWLTPGFPGLVSSDATPDQPRGVGKPAALIAGQALTGLDLRLAPMGSIGGRVLDPSGAPVPGIAISLGQPRQVATVVVMLGNQSTRTDAEGRYQFVDLAPGDYYVMALAGPFGQAVPGNRDTVSEAVLGYVPTYFPGTDRALGAQALRVEIGSNPPPANFSLMQGTLVTMTGSVSDMQDRPVANANLMLIPTDGGNIQADLASKTSSGADGRFIYPSVPAGAYVLQCFAGAAFGSRPVVIAPLKDGVSGINVMVRPLVTARGRVTFDGGPPPEQKSVRINFVPTDFASGPIGSNALLGKIADDWTFEIENLAWTGLIRAMGPPGWALKSVRLNGQEIATKPADFHSGDVDGLELVMTNRLASITGTVIDDSNPASFFTVLVQPEAGSPGTMALQSPSVLRRGPSGSFTISQLLPGRYRLLAVPSIASAQDIRIFQSSATSVTVADGEIKTVALKLMKR